MNPRRALGTWSLGLAQLMGCDAWLPDQPDAAMPEPMCEHSLRITGSVAGTQVFAEGYVPQAEWFDNSTIEERLLDAAQRASMKQLGLDPEDDADVARFRYLVSGFDLRLLERESLESGSLPKVARDFGIYLYDLETYRLQPAQEIEVFDITSIEGPRDAGDLDTLGNALRRLLDAMRDNGKPDALVAFSRDRSQESFPVNALVNLVVPDTRFASSGHASFHDPRRDGKALASLKYPVRDLQTISLTFEAAFGSDLVQGEAECAPLVVYER